MINRRLMLALPLLAPTCLGIAHQAAAQPADGLALVLAACWQARGVRFAPAAISARIAGRSGMAALLAVAGAADSADGEEVETAVEILWLAGQAPLPTEPLLHRDLEAGLPLLLIGRDGQAYLLHALVDGAARISDAVTHAMALLPLSDAALIGRPVISGA